MKRLSLLLFAGLFGFATLQTATAQEDNHNVTINVSEVNEISADGNPTIDIGADDFNEWVADGDEGTYDVTTNASSKKRIDVSASANGIGDKANLEGFRVKTDDMPAGADAGNDVSGDYVDLIDNGGFLNDKNIVRNVENVDEEELGLTYEAKVGPEYNPGDDGDIEVTYTLTDQ